MDSNQFDIIIVGGGIGGASLGKVLAEAGMRVLVVEKDREFRDRVRGEAMAPWGVPEAKALGIYQLLRETCGHEVPWLRTFIRTTLLDHRNLPATTRCQAAEFAFYHPAMQDVLLQAASDAGAVVWRGIAAREIQRSSLLALVLDEGGRRRTAHARMIVGADGRLSSVRRMGGFETLADPQERSMTGVLLEGMRIPQDTTHAVIDPRGGQLVALFPQGHDRVRAYFSYPNDVRRPLQGAAALPELIQQCRLAGAEAEWYDGARLAGPMAAFPSDDRWVPDAHRDGVVLIGDAAASNDPMYGQGMSLALRDVRVLRDCLLAQDDWVAAADEYARAHNEYYQKIHTFSHWYETLFYRRGVRWDLLRARVLPLLSQDGTRLPDVLFSGPDEPLTETERKRMFGED
jgi:menaquinone-9 beta-reductase